MQGRNKLESLQTKALFSPTISISPVLSLAAGGLGALGSLPAVSPGPSSTIAQNRHFASSFTSPDVHMSYSRDSGSGRLGTSIVTDRPAVMVNSALRNCSLHPVTGSRWHASWLWQVNSEGTRVNDR